MASTAVKQASKVKALPRRCQVKAADTWNLASLCADDAAWETAFEQWEKQIAGFDAFRGKLGDSARTLAACLRFDAEFDRAGERLGTYAFLKTAEDATNSQYQRMLGRYRHAASQAAQAASFIRPEIMAIKSSVMEKLLAAKELAEYRLLVERMLRYKPHTLTRSGEKLLAMQSEMSEASNQIFRQLSDADLKWGLVKNEHGEWVELSNSSLVGLLALAQAQRAQASLSQVLRTIQRPSEHAGRHARIVGPARRLLCQGARLSQRAGSGPVPRQHAADGL